MPPSARQLRFTVSTSLLTASLALAPAGCNKKHTVNVAHPDDEPHVNEGPEPESPPADAPVESPDADAPVESPEPEAEA